MATERPSDQKIQTEKGKAELKRKQYNASINVKSDRGGGGTPGICGAFDFWSKSPPWGPKIGSNQIKYPHLFHQFILKMSMEK